MGRLIIDGNRVYEVDENCIREKQKKEMEQKRKENQEKTREKKQKIR